VRQNKIYIIITAIALMLSSCLKSYEPIITSSDAGKYVVSGQVNRGDAVQRINVSISSPIYKATYNPVTDCKVKILDDKGNSYTTTDQKNGNYEVSIPESEFKPGISFKVDVLLPGGDNIVSDFDQIQDCPEVDSVYYIQQEVPGINPGIPAQGIQFYLNLNGTNITCRNFMFEAYETWEYHSAYPIEWYYNGFINHRYPPDFSRMVCWKTALVKNFFTLTTRNQTQNMYTRFPLHIVDNYSSPRLEYGYSLLIRQYALSDAAFIYWEKIQLNSNQEAGLYERQPLASKGNMHNLTDPDREVLGFFGATTVKSKRIFVRPIKDLLIKYDPKCDVGTGLKSLDQIHFAWYPAYLFGDNGGYRLEMIRPDCVDCLRLGGINVKPVFWPN
jgi:hypothetical protein